MTQKENNAVVSPDTDLRTEPMKEVCRKVSMGTKLGYGFGSIAVSIGYDFVAGFLLFFLTAIAGITPYFAGTIIFIAILWDAITDPIIGILSDNSKSKYGKRRPFILVSAVPFGLTIALLFLAVDFGPFFTNAYYLVMALAFWTAFTVYFIPYNALGACMTLDNDERTRISSIRQLFNFLGVLFATALPTLLVGTFRANGMVPENAWFYTAVILGVVIVLNILVTWYSTKGKEIFELTGNKITLKDIWAEIRDIFRLRVYKIIIVALFIYYVGHTIMIGNIIFFGTFILNITEDTLSLIYLIIVGSGMLYAILLGTVAVKFDKRNVFIACMLFSSLALIMAKFIGLSTFLHLAILAVLATVGVAAFATLSYVLVFDVIEVDEFKNGKRREGVIFAYQSLVKKVGAAGAAWTAGALLQFSGFEREALVQSEKTLATIESLATLYPGILMGLCGLALFFFPITKKRHSALMKAMALKKQGLEYSTEEFDILLK